MRPMRAEDGDRLTAYCDAHPRFNIHTHTKTKGTLLFSLLSSSSAAGWWWWWWCCVCVCSSSSVGSPLLKAAAAEQSTERGGLPSGTTTLLLTGACHCRLWQQLHRLYFISAYSFFFPLFMATYYTKVKVRSSTECDDVITLSSPDFYFLLLFSMIMMTIRVNCLAWQPFPP